MVLLNGFFFLRQRFFLAKLEKVDLDTLQAYAKEKGDQIAADAESKGEVIAPVEPEVSEMTPSGELEIGFSEPVVAFGGGEPPAAEDIIEVEMIEMPIAETEVNYIEEEILEI